MKRAIRKYARDFAAIVALFIVALGVTAYILSNQRLTLPAWAPVVGKEFYEFKGEFRTAQAVTPGQGQTVTVAGVNVGDIAKVTLKDGRAVVTMRIDQDEHPEVTVYKDATMLLRPKTGLRDMVVALNPGTKEAGELPEDGVIPVSNTLPDVNLDEILATLDADTRQYLQLLLGGAAEGLRGNGKDLGQTLRRFQPLARDGRRVAEALAARKQHIRRVIHNLSLLTGELGDKNDDLAKIVDSSNAVFATIAEEDANLRAALQELPPALRATRTTLGKTKTLAETLAPAAGALRPAARNLAPALRESRPFLRAATPIIRDQLRPFSRAALPTVGQLRPALRDLSAATPDLVRATRVVNYLLNTLAYNPPGETEEGYLFWFSWANHLAATVFNTQDAHGPVRRGLIVFSCSTLGLLDQVKQVNPSLATVIGLLNTPRTSSVCPATTGAPGE